MSNYVDVIRNALEDEHGREQVVVTKLTDDSGVIAVLPMRNDGKSNARIYDATGNLRCEIEIPGDYRSGLGFSDAYYVHGELTAIFVTPGRDFAFVVDEQSGKIRKSYETR